MATPPDVIHSARDSLKQLRPGDHLCHLYASEDEHRAVLTPFLQHGLERGERVLYVADFHTPSEILKYLRDAGLDVGAYQARDQLRLLTPAEAYVRDGTFDPLRMIALLEQETDQARRDGYTALRVTGEMTWALRGLPGSDRLIEYEIALDRFFATHAALAICQYDRRRFSPDMLLRVIEVHPIVIVGAEVCDNFYFVPPDDFGRPDRAERQLKRQLDTLTERRRLESELWQHRRRLEQEVLSRTRDLEEINQHLQREVEQHRQTAKALRQSEAFLKQTQHITRVGGWEYDTGTGQVTWTDEVYRIHAVGADYDPSDINRAIRFYAPPDQALIDRAFQRAVELGEPYDLELQFVSATGRARWVRTSGQVETVAGRVTRVFGNIMDITERKRAEQTLQARLRLVHFAADHSLHELLVATLDKAGQLTDSPIGFYHFLDTDQHTLTLQAWSTRTTAEFCTAAGQGQHYNIDQAGVWVDCVRERRPIVHNDYAALPASRRKGLPPGHAHVERELVVPVFRGELIVAILGVGNKPQPYDDQDMATVSLLADLAWEVAERKLAETAQRESEENYRRLFQNASIGIFHSLPEGRFLRVNPALAAMLGYASPEELISTVTDIRTQIYLDTNRHAAVLGNTLQREGWVYAENRYRRKDGSVLIGNLAVRKELHADGTLAYLEGFVEDITERKRMAEAEREHRALAEALRDTATVLNSTLNLDEVLDRILLGIGRVVAHEAVSLMLLDADQAVARVARYRGYTAPGTETLVGGLQFEVADAPNLKMLAETRRPLVIADVREYPGWLSVPGRDWIRSYAGVPIRSRDQVVGFLNLYSATPGFYTEALAERLQAFADQAAIAVENAQLHARIQTHVDELEQRVAERTHELTAANARLTELDRLKDEFISRISHELRTPLTSIRIYLDLLENGQPERRGKYLRTLNEQSERLQRLIESLLDVSRLNVARDDVQLQSIDLNDAANQLTTGSRAAAVRHGLTLTLELTADLPPVRADALLLPQALSPILSNALTYTPAGGSITVTTALQHTADQPWGTLTVHDTGPGIDPTEVSLIFDRFYRGSAARDYRTPGTGLGLSISRALIEKCGGRITVESTPGRGAAFTVWLPLA
jgi:PAS domain S-box-containing protein